MFHSSPSLPTTLIVLFCVSYNNIFSFHDILQGIYWALPQFLLVFFSFLCIIHFIFKVTFTYIWNRNESSSYKKKKQNTKNKVYFIQFSVVDLNGRVSVYFLRFNVDQTKPVFQSIYCASLINIATFNLFKKIFVIKNY